MMIDFITVSLFYLVKALAGNPTNSVSGFLLYFFKIGLFIIYFDTIIVRTEIVFVMLQV